MNIRLKIHCVISRIGYNCSFSSLTDTYISPKGQECSTAADRICSPINMSTPVSTHNLLHECNKSRLDKQFHLVSELSLNRLILRIPLRDKIFDISWSPLFLINVWY